MKRTSDQQAQQQSYGSESNKKPRYAQSSYGNDVYAQYGLMSQYGSTTPFQANQASYAGYTPQPNSSMYMYGTPQTMMSSQYANYPQSFQPNPMMPNPSGEATRTIYLGNVNGEMDPHDILKHVHSGPVENFRMVPERNCAFLSFVDPSSAQLFYQEYMTKKLIVNNLELKLGWGKTSIIPSTLKIQIQGGATRNVYLGRLTEHDTEQSIRTHLTKFGPIESVKLLRDKNIAFVHFLNIMSAVKCVSSLPAEWPGKKVNYGKDHCADGTGSDPYAMGGFQAPYSGLTYDPFAFQTMTNGANIQRTLYLGNVHQDATCEDICNVIRGGNLIMIRYFPEKHIAFITFMDPNTALNVYNHITTSNLNIKGKRVRVGWGKPCTISTQVALAVQNGATRNVYIGGVPDDITVEKLRSDFSEFGDIELVNIFKEKNCAFVNFTHVANAMSALAGIKQKPEYAELKINYGKDRCGNPWRPMNKTKKPTEGAPDASDEPTEPAEPVEEAPVKLDELEEPI